MKAFKDSSLATDVITHDVSPLTVNTDARAYSRLGWVIVLVGVVGFLVWAAFAPLDKGVPLSGVVAKEGNRKTIQHQNGGIIKEILVQDGDVVKKGQILLRMNDVAAKSQAEVSRVQYYAARAAEARLLAERSGAKAIDFPPELTAAKADPRVAEVISVQQNLFFSRQAALQSELGSADENVAGLKIQAQGLQESRDSLKQQQGILKQQIDDMRDLAKDGYVARNRLLDVERTYAQIAGSMAETVGNLGRAQRQVLELGLRRAQRVQEAQRDVSTSLADTQKEAEALRSRIESLDFDVANADVKSPVDGVVVGSNVFTNGGVVGPGARLMDVVPTDDGLVVEGQLAVNLVDRVHPGLPVDLIFSAFNSNRTPHIPGELIQVAADRTVEERTGQAYYKVRVKVTPAGAKLIAQHKLDVRPGMPVELFVKTGERTMMSYLLKPVFDRAKTSMTEE